VRQAELVDHVLALDDQGLQIGVFRACGGVV
jgi:hypothetical protein